MTRPVLYNRAAQLTASYSFTLPADNCSLLFSLWNSSLFLVETIFGDLVFFFRAVILYLIWLYPVSLLSRKPATLLVRVLPCFRWEVMHLVEFCFVMFDYSSEAIYKGCLLFSLGCYNFITKLKPSSFLLISSCGFPGTYFNHPQELPCSPNKKKGCAWIHLL